MSSATVPPTTLFNPFPGLRPFREDEEHLFFGRESQVDTMVDKLARTRFLAVVGTSGSGKSSLVNCGLRPALHRGLMARAGTSWRMVQFRPGGKPFRAITRALARDGVLFSKFQAEGLSLEEIVDATLRMSNLGLVDLYGQAQLDDGVNLLIVVDQFEELFRFRQTAAASTGAGPNRSQEDIAFVNLLLEAKAHPDVPVYVVLTMRSDFLGDCAQFAGSPEAINESQYLVPRMTRDERRGAIAGPVAVGGGEISPVLLTRLVNDVGDNPDQLSILQHALNRTWARWQHEGRGEGPLSLAHYEAIGTMAHALDQHAEKAYGELRSDREKAIGEKLFKALTDKGTDPRGVRRPTTLAILCAVADASQDEVAQVTEVFRKPSRSFLMPPVPDPLEPEMVIDISHESLMRVWQRLTRWADEEAQSARLYRRLSETAALYAAGNAGLWGDPDLQLALNWQEEQRPSAAWAERYGGTFEQAVRFLAESAALRAQRARDKELQRQREVDHDKMMALAEEQTLRLAIQLKSAKRMRVFAVALGVMFALAVVAGIFAIWQSAVARREAALRVEEARHAENDARFRAYRAEDLRIQAETARQELQATMEALFNTVGKNAGVSPEKRVAEVEAALGPHSVATLPRVYLQIVDQKDRGHAEDLAKKLRKAGFVVPGTEYVARAAGLKKSDVRYYRKDDEDRAKEIQQILKDAGEPADLSALGMENARPNHFEVWLARTKASP